MTEKTGEHTETRKAPETKGSVQPRAGSIEVLIGNNITRSQKVVVDLEIPADDILASVHFSSALFTPEMVRGVLKDALEEAKWGRSQRQWRFEVVCIRIDDPKCKELQILQYLEKEIQNGTGPVSEVQSLESFLNANRLSKYLSVELSNKKLTTLTPVEIIYLAYTNKLSSLTAYFPFMPLDHVVKYGNKNSAPIEILKKCVPLISFPHRVYKVLNAKARIDGHLLDDSETRVRRDSNSYFLYKFHDNSLS